MTRIFHLLVATLLAVTSASAIVTEKRASTNHVRDGSFEQISEDNQFTRDATLGGWTFSGAFTVSFDSTGNYCKNDDGTKYNCTPYGKAFAIAFRFGTGRRGSVSQPVSGLESSSYTLSYAYAPEFTGSKGCILTATLGSQIIDSINIPGNLKVDTFQWMPRSTTFTPAIWVGILSFNLNCPKGSTKPDYYEVYLDNVRLIGQA